MHDPDVVVFLELLIAVAVVAAVVEYVHVPYTVALVLAGLVLALLPTVPHLQLTPALILTVFLPVLLFHGAYNLDLMEVRRNLTPIALLAVPGVMVTSALVGLALHLMTHLSWSQALLFGTIVAATDPVAVLAVFGETGAPRRLSTIVTGESLFNDGTALVFFSTVLAIATTHTVQVGQTVESFIVAVAGALVLGTAVGIAGSVVLRSIDDALLETTITLIMAYGGFLLADHLGSSGPIETVTAGLLLGARGTEVLSPTTRVQASATWAFLDFLANSLLFLLVGLALAPIGRTSTQLLDRGFWWALLVAIVAILVARVLVIWAVTGPMVRRWGVPRAWRMVLVWAGLRGAVSLAAALSIPVAFPGRRLLIALTFGVVLFTILVQGLTIRPVLAWLHVGTRASRHDMEVALAHLAAAEAASRELQSLRDGGGVDPHLIDPLQPHFQDQVDRLQEELAGIYHRDQVLKDQQEYELRRQLLDAQREAVRDAYARGQISDSVRREVTAELDDERSQLEVVMAEGEQEGAE